MNMIPAQMQIPGLDMTANLHSVATEVLCLMNMVEVEELMDDEEYEGKSSTDVGIGHLSPLLPTSLSNRSLPKNIGTASRLRGQICIFLCENKFLESSKMFHTAA